ncbi:hypothetical protein BDZ91DRAFT_752199 [Kalaharituber pfeilii]|nr:hypothetical protein BDZ91DRAFT_752199 [Kalaharituber pfeilii]
MFLPVFMPALGLHTSSYHHLEKPSHIAAKIDVIFFLGESLIIRHPVCDSQKEMVLDRICKHLHIHQALMLFHGKFIS